MGDEVEWGKSWKTETNPLTYWVCFTVHQLTPYNLYFRFALTLAITENWLALHLITILYTSVKLGLSYDTGMVCECGLPTPHPC